MENQYVRRLGCRATVLCAAVAVLSGCGTLPLSLSNGQQSALPRRQATLDQMTPGADSVDLLYVSHHRTVSVYAYPKGKLVGTLRGFLGAYGMCVDKNGNVYVSDMDRGELYEYAHGSKTRLRTIEVGAHTTPLGCSIDPTTGNLAVSDIVNADVAVFGHARGRPKFYRNSLLSEAYWPAYDDKGNLFLDGRYFSSPPSFELFELAKGSDKLITVTVNQPMGFPGGVQWDGGDLAVATYHASGPRSGKPVIYRFNISGSGGTKMGTTELGGAVNVMQFAIDGKTVVVPNNKAEQSDGNALFYHYPAGGKAYKTITKDMRVEEGAAISPRLRTAYHLSP